MIDELNTHLFSFESKIDEQGNIKIPNEKFLDLMSKGFYNIKVDVSGSTSMALDILKINKEIFSSIKKAQTLPDTVVLNFMQSKGVLHQTDFLNRFAADNE